MHTHVWVISRAFGFKKEPPSLLSPPLPGESALHAPASSEPAKTGRREGKKERERAENGNFKRRERKKKREREVEGHQGGERREKRMRGRGRVR